MLEAQRKWVVCTSALVTLITDFVTTHRYHSPLTPVVSPTAPSVTKQRARRPQPPYLDQTSPHYSHCQPSNVNRTARNQFHSPLASPPTHVPEAPAPRLPTPQPALKYGHKLETSAHGSSKSDTKRPRKSSNTITPQTV